jgi:hypothetical protein
MKTLLHKLALTATTVAVSAGTLTLTSSGASAEPAGPQLNPSLHAKALTACANPTWDIDAATQTETYFPNTPDTVVVYAQGTISAPDSSVTGRWAVVRADVGNTPGDRCLVAEIDEPDAVKNNADTSGSIHFDVPDQAPEFGYHVLNPDYANDSDLKYEHSGVASQHHFNDLFFNDTDNDPATARVAQVGGILDPWPAVVNVKLAVSGTETVSTAMPITTNVMLERTPAEKATALDNRRAADRNEHAAHDKAAHKVRKAKSAARAKIQHSKLSKKAKKSALNRIDRKARASYRVLSADCVAHRKANRAVYTAAIAPYPGKVTTIETSRAEKPFNDSTTGYFFQPS